MFARFLTIVFSGLLYIVSGRELSVSKSKIWGPGLKADFRVPVRYFFIQAVDTAGNKFNDSLGDKVFTVSIAPLSGVRARIWTQVLDRHDGSYVVRYRAYSNSQDLAIEILGRGKHVADSPYVLEGIIYSEICDCANQSPEEWTASVQCPASYEQIKTDFAPFKVIDMKKVVPEAIKRFHHSQRHSICHYKVIDNQVYRKCYGEHVGFKMFSDAILLSLARKMTLPDVEFFMNLGDWPLERRKSSPIPVVSWCGSAETTDIVVPTYDLTEATLEMMGRVSLDIFSTQANTGPKWVNKTNVAFWRGRDSRQERLDLVQMSRKNPQLVDAALTNMFFFPKDEEKYGKIVKHISFFDFFKSKYQLNIDGTVAAYRLPYLLAGDSVIFKQDSEYYEHFYRELEPNVHYIPLKRDLSDVLDKIKWARENDEEVYRIAMKGQEYARDNLTPAHVLCYHVRVIQEFVKKLKHKPALEEGFEKVEQSKEECECHMPKVNKRDEL